MKNRLCVVPNKDIIPLLEKKGILLVYPLKDYSVGYPITFDINDIKTDGFLYINRILNCNDIDNLKVILNKLSNNIKGIIFEDLGIIELLKDLDIKKILYCTHFTTNHKSINYLFEYVDDIIISTDITEEEIDYIIKNSNKRVSLFVFGLVPSMYSRRYLNTNHAINYSLNKDDILKLENSNKKFIAIENEYGTYIYHFPYFNGIRLINKDINYAFYNPLLLENEKVIDILDGKVEGIDTDDGFLNQKTIYKLR